MQPLITFLEGPSLMDEERRLITPVVAMVLDQLKQGEALTTFTKTLLLYIAQEAGAQPADEMLALVRSFALNFGRSDFQEVGEDGMEQSGI
jgi:hypothetical protein